MNRKNQPKKETRSRQAGNTGRDETAEGMDIDESTGLSAQAQRKSEERQNKPLPGGAGMPPHVQARPEETDREEVDEAGEESFPASDAPSWSTGRRRKKAA